MERAHKLQLQRARAKNKKHEFERNVFLERQHYPGGHQERKYKTVQTPSHHPPLPTYTHRSLIVDIDAVLLEHKVVIV